jgi:hypothetical protein
VSVSAVSASERERYVLPVSANELLRGDRVQYTGPRTADGSIDTGDIGWVTKTEGDSVFVVWRTGKMIGVPIVSVSLLEPEVTRVVERRANARMWGLLGEELPPLRTGRPRDPYMSQGCHPDIVVRVWDLLGKKLPEDCRAQAKGKPVLAHPGSDRIFAVAHGTAYALWLTPDDFSKARRAGAATEMEWSGGSVTDLAERAGPGWIWGRWYADEPRWLLGAYAASG